MSKVRSRDDILMIIISKMFRVVFYEVLFDMNVQNKEEEAKLENDTIDIIDEIYDYFYNKIFIDITNELDGVVIQTDKNNDDN